MTIYFPDISNFQAGLTLEKDTVAVIAKASEGATFTDTTYKGFKAQAARIGAVFSAYHFLWSATDAEVRHCHSIVGSTPLMIDAENTSVRTTVAMIVAFAKAYRKLGGRVWGVYLPRWYWQGNLGSPSLKPLADAGLALVSSNYTAYSDSGPGWSGYGGMTPVQWQYTSGLSYGGRKVDFNAYKGSVAQLRALWSGGATEQEEDDMPTAEQLWNWDGIPAPKDSASYAKNKKWTGGNALAEAVRASRSSEKLTRALMAQMDPAGFAAKLAPLLQAAGPISQAMLEAALHNVLGSLDDDAPAE